MIPLAAVLGWIEGNQLTARLGNMIQGNGLAGLLARGRQEAGFKGLVTGLLKQPGETMKTLLAGARHMLGEGVNNAIEEVLQDASQFLTEEGIQAASGNQSVMEAINNMAVFRARHSRYRDGNALSRSNRPLRRLRRTSRSFRWRTSPTRAIRCSISCTSCIRAVRSAPT